jgi:glycine hydroxymethyltransferase
VDIALQGPKSRDILLSLGCSAVDKKKIMKLKRTELCEAKVGEFDLVVSRTGYTGEKMAFELFIHPDRTAELWEALLKTGSQFGIKPCGLGARDSLRTEAGLPLYGHEFTPEGDLGVAEGGFGSYVKTYKPWFIGRQAFIEKEKNRTRVIARFRFNEKAVRMAHNGDPVLDGKGKVIGKVTSCAIDSEGFLTGQAIVEEKSSLEGTPIFIFQSASKINPAATADLKPGERVTLPTPAVILSRFPKLG